MPTYRVNIVRLIQQVVQVTVTADSDSSEDLQPAVNAADQSEYTTVSSDIVSEQTLDYTVVE